MLMLLIGLAGIPSAWAGVDGGLAFLGVSRDNQVDSRLTERVGKSLARMGEALHPRSRGKLCKDVACFKELAQSQPLRRAGLLMNVELYQSDARQQSITVRLYDVSREKLEETVEACEQCDDENRSSIILTTYARLSRQLTAVQTDRVPDVIDAIEDECPNLEGIQRELPANMTRDRSGRCVPLPPTDVCPNLPGVQSGVPVDFVRDTSGNCVAAVAPPSPPRTDACPNLPGQQDGIPSGMVRSQTGECVEDKAKGPDQCANLEGIQDAVPAGMYRDPESGSCIEEPPPDQCLNLNGRQAKVPPGLLRDEHGNCVAASLPMPRSTRDRYVVSSSLFGGMAILSLAVVVTGTVLRSMGSEQCYGIHKEGADMFDVNCRSDALMIVGLSSAGAFAALSIGLSIPLWNRTQSLSDRHRSVKGRP